MSDNPASSTEFELQITTPAHLGQGLGRVDGKVVMVPFAAVGDRISAVVTADHGRWAEARIASILGPGPGRAEPRCPVYGRCGGCHLQHLSEDAHREWKLAVLRDVISKIGKIELPEIGWVSGDPWGCRCRVSMHADGDGLARDAGFFEKASHRIVPPGRCPAAMPAVASLLEPLRAAVRAGAGRGPAEIEPVCGADGRCVVVVNQKSGDADRLHRAVEGLPGVSGVVSRGGAPAWKSSGDRTIRWPTAGLPGSTEFIDVDPRGFTQANMGMNPALVETVIGHLGGTPAGMNVVELYAGAGNITLPLAMRGAMVMASDINGPAMDAGADACRLRGLDVEHASGDAKAVIAGLRGRFRRPDAVVADPPRTGLGPAAGDIAALGAGTVVVCSCEPSSLARDLGPFIAGGYSVAGVTLVDMFPWTYHMETVISLTFNRFCGESPIRSAQGLERHNRPNFRG